MARAKRYINNRDFANAIAAWKTEKEAAVANGETIPIIPNYIAECFLKIVNRYGSRKNFSGYTYINDMKSEALEHCVKYADRFKIEKSENAFAYFTQVTYHAFIQFITKEKKQAKMKFGMMEDSLENAHKYNYNNITSEEDWQAAENESR